MQCQRCGGTVLPQYEVFEPPHEVCTMCGREPGVELVTRMRGVEEGVGLSGDYRRCGWCGLKVERGAERCSCGAYQGQWSAPTVEETERVKEESDGH